MPFSTESWQTRDLDCSRLSPLSASNPIPPTPTDDAGGYLDYLRATLPPRWTADAAHIRLIAEHLDRVERGEIDRLAIHMPPRHGKSETVTYRFPVRWLERNPKANVLVTGYNERFARKFGRRCRNLAAERGLVSGDKTAADEWETTSGGLLMTRGVGSPPTGTGFNLIVIDDPVRRRQDAESLTLREAAWDWYTDDLYQRLEPGGAIVLIMTLWHCDDIGARAVASEPGRWTVLKLPALAEGDADPLGRKEGEALWPERYSADDLTRIRDVMAKNEGERSFTALYQQRPTAKEGDFFKVSQLQFVDALPLGIVRTARAWDFASSKKGDWSAGVKMSLGDDGYYYISHVRRARWMPDEKFAQVRLTAETDGKKVVIRIPEDPGAAGVDTAVFLTRHLAGFTVKAENVTGDKATRAEPFATQVNAGNVRILRGDWNTDFVEELRAFPNGAYDDQVDAGSDAFEALTRAPGRFRAV